MTGLSTNAGTNAWWTNRRKHKPWERKEEEEEEKEKEEEEELYRVNEVKLGICFKLNWVDYLN